MLPNLEFTQQKGFSELGGVVQSYGLLSEGAQEYIKGDNQKHLLTAKSLTFLTSQTRRQQYHVITCHLGWNPWHAGG